MKSGSMQPSHGTLVASSEVISLVTTNSNERRC